jgi:hypothetical protein
MKGFIMKEITSKGRQGIISMMKANMIKEKLCDNPLEVKFTFSRSEYAMQRAVKPSDINFVLDRMLKSHVGVREIDYEVRVIE